MAWADASTGVSLLGSGECAGSGTLRAVVFTIASQALGQTLALLATFIGIGILVNVLIFYIVALVLGERKQNRERQASR